MGFLHWLENIRMPVLNEFMLAITHLGAEVAFLVIALILFWCVDKRRGYYILSVGFLGTIGNQFMKLWFRILRPWYLDPTLQPLEQALEGAEGFSFPSGHTQNAVGTFGGIAYTARRKLVRVVCIVLAVLVPFSRMSVGVHTPLDVGVAAAMALLLMFVVRPLVMRKDGKYFITTGFKELDNALMGWQRGEDLVTIIGRVNEGKCLIKGTEVIMALIFGAHP